MPKTLIPIMANNRTSRLHKNIIFTLAMLTTGTVCVWKYVLDDYRLHKFKWVSFMIQKAILQLFSYSHHFQSSERFQRDTTSFIQCSAAYFDLQHRNVLTCKYCLQWRIWGGRQFSGLYDFIKNSRKLHEIEENLAPRGMSSTPSLDPPLVSFRSYFFY